MINHITLHALEDELAAQGVVVSHDTVWRFQGREGLCFKKTALTLEHSRADVARRRRLWRVLRRGHWKTLTFTADVDQILILPLSRGDVVIMDNLGSHKGKAVREAIHDAGRRCQVPLPAAIFPRPQSHRAALLKTQTLHAQSIAQNPRYRMAPPWSAPKHRDTR